jgi:hypothetical protein
VLRASGSTLILMMWKDKPGHNELQCDVPSGACPHYVDRSGGNFVCMKTGLSFRFYNDADFPAGLCFMQC